MNENHEAMRLEHLGVHVTDDNEVYFEPTIDHGQYPRIWFLCEGDRWHYRVSVDSKVPVEQVDKDTKILDGWYTWGYIGRRGGTGADHMTREAIQHLISECSVHYRLLYEQAVGVANSDARGVAELAEHG